MSIEAMTVVLHHSKSQGAAKLVLLGIANHQGDGGAWPSIATLAKYAGGIDRRTVQRALRDLTRAGELSCEIQAGGSYGDDSARPNRYWVLLTCPPECDGTTNHRKRVLDDEVQGGRHPRRPGGGTSAAGGAAPTPPKPSLEPSVEPKPYVQAGLEPEFEKFWDIYPRKQGKGKARDAFIKAYKQFGDVVITGAANFAADPNLPLEKQYIPLPATWLNQERWNDEPLPERELTPEQKKAKAQADYERNREAALRASEERLAEYRRAAEEAAKNPPKRCEHDRVAVMCRACNPRFRTT